MDVYKAPIVIIFVSLDRSHLPGVMPDMQQVN